MRHSKELRDKAIAEAQAGKKPVLEIAFEIGVSPTTLRNWMRAAETRARTQGKVKKVAAALGKDKVTETSQRMRLLIHALEQSPATIIVTDDEGRILYANPKFAETTGYTAEEALGKTPSFLKSGHTSDREYADLWRTIRAGKEWRGVFHNRRKDGSLYWERASISPVYDADGRIANFMAVKENITEYMEAEEARSIVEQRFRAVVMALAEGVLLLDEHGRIALANLAAERILAHAQEQLLGRRVEELNLRWLTGNGESVTQRAHPIRRVLEQGDVVRQETYGIIAPNNFTRWVVLSAQPAAGNVGRASSIVVSFADITERRASEERLNLVGTVFDNSVEGIMVTDARNRIMSVNAAFSGITGYAFEEVAGKTPRLLSSGKHDDAFYKDMWSTLGAHGRWQGQVWNRRKNGQLYLSWLSISAVHDAEGAVSQYVALFFDMGR